MAFKGVWRRTGRKRESLDLFPWRLHLLPVVPPHRPETTPPRDDELWEPRDGREMMGRSAQGCPQAVSVTRVGREPPAPRCKAEEATGTTWAPNGPPWIASVTRGSERCVGCEFEHGDQVQVPRPTEGTANQSQTHPWDAVSVNHILPEFPYSRLLVEESRIVVQV